MSEQTVSRPYIDHRSATRKRTPDWIVTVRKGALIQTYRFNSEEEAEDFAARTEDGIE